jgi:molecular chaperone DnaK (HSP70)
MRRRRFAVILACLILGACASPQGGTTVGLSSAPLAEGSLMLDDVGVMLPSEGFAPILARGCELPCRGMFHLRTSSDNQERIRVRLLRRSFERRAVVSRLVDFQVTEIPPGPAGERQVEVTLRAKKESLTIYAVEKQTDTPVKIRTILFIGE